MYSPIAIIKVLYNTSQSEYNRLLKETDSLSADHFVVDNTGTQYGYAEGINELIEMALRGKRMRELFIIMNPDISVASLTSQHIQELMEQFDIGGFAMRQNGNIYYGGELDRWRMSGGLTVRKPSQRYVNCDFVSGSLMVIKRKVIEKIGLFDESYGMYYEDVDYCIRAKKAGFKIGIDSHVLYDHFETSDTNPRKKTLLANNRRKILWKYGSFPQKLLEIIKPL